MIMCVPGGRASAPWRARALLRGTGASDVLCFGGQPCAELNKIALHCSASYPVKKEREKECAKDFLEARLRAESRAKNRAHIVSHSRHATPACSIGRA